MQDQPATATQCIIDSIRDDFASQPRRDAMVGWCLVLVAVAVPAIAAAIVILF